MEESPRASKRRKLDTPSPAPPTSSAKPSTARKSSRLANKPTVRHTFTNDDDDGSEDEVVPAVAAPTRKRVTRKPSRPAIPQKETENPDIWDDIEAASGERSVAPTLLRSIPAAKKTPARRSAQSRGKASKGQESDELHVTAPTPRSTKKSNATKESRLNKRTIKLVTNGSTEDFEVEADTSDELGQVTTAGKRPPTSIRKTASTRQSKNTDQSQPFTTTGKAASSKKPPKKPAASSGTNGASRVTPARSSRRQQPRPQENGAMSYDEDELEVAPQESPSVVKNSTRRKLHRANHTSNEDDEIIVDAEENLESDIQEDGGGNMSVDGNSIAGSTLDPTEPSPFNKPSPAQKSDLVTPKLSIHLEAGQGLDLLKSILLERIAGKRPAPLINLDEEYSSVYQIIHQTITAGEGNSMLVIGARGSGKTALVNKALAEVHKENREDYHVVRLNGFIHTDDKIALREIWRQLGKEMELDEEGGGVGKSYADALTTLLALLSHPSEQTGEETDYTARAVIFIMDEFDLFAQHARQTLLYNLFDIAQSRKAPIAVLGLTTRIDVANSLEKRVKSRFSHRYVHLSLAKTFSAFQDMCKANLLVHTDQLSIAERAILEPSISSPATKQKKGKKSNLLADWNKNINTLFTNKSFLTTHLAPIYHLTKSIPELLTTFLDPIAALSPSTSTLDPPSTTSLPPTSKLSLIPHLSTLALSLLIAAARLDIIHDSDTCNFNMAYDEYVSLASKARIQNGVGGVSVGGSMSKVWGKEVARREWEGLVELGFVMPVLLGAVGGFGMVRVDVALEEIGAVLRGGAAKGVEKGLERWCRQI